MKKQFTTFNFNLLEMKKDFISNLKEAVSYEFKKKRKDNTDELFRCKARNRRRIVEIVVLNTGCLNVHLEMEGIESFYTANHADEKQEGMTMKEFEKILPDLKDFLKTGNINKENFEKCSSGPDDWAAPIYP